MLTIKITNMGKIMKGYTDSWTVVIAVVICSCVVAEVASEFVFENGVEGDIGKLDCSL